MPRLHYVALDARGQESTGLVEANSTNEAIGQLRQAGYFPTNVYEEAKRPRRKGNAPADSKGCAYRRKSGAKNIVLFQRKTVKPKVLMIFTRQLATLIDSGLPLLRGLNVLGKTGARYCPEKHDQQAGRFRAERQHVFRGARAASAIFNDLYVNMVKAGEVGGVLEVVLTRLASSRRKPQRSKTRSSRRWFIRSS